METIGALEYDAVAGFGLFWHAVPYRTPSTGAHLKSF